VRIHLAVGFADDLLVLADAGPRVAAKGRRLRARRIDLDPGDARLGERRGKGRRERERE
jgi:hypothetical protein